MYKAAVLLELYNQLPVLLLFLLQMVFQLLLQSLELAASVVAAAASRSTSSNRLGPVALSRSGSGSSYRLSGYALLLLLLLLLRALLLVLALLLLKEGLSPCPGFCCSCGDCFICGSSSSSKRLGCCPHGLALYVQLKEVQDREQRSSSARQEGQQRLFVNDATENEQKLLPCVNVLKMR